MNIFVSKYVPRFFSTVIFCNNKKIKTARELENGCLSTGWVEEI